MNSSRLNTLHKALFLAVQLGISTAYLSGVVSVAQAADNSIQAEQRQYSIGRGPLGQVLNNFALQANIDLSMNASLTSGKRSAGVTGAYNIEGALSYLLSGTGLVARQTATGRFVLHSIEVPSKQHSNALKSDTQTMVVYGRSNNTDEDGYNDVYDKNTSTIYRGKEEIERYKGTTPSDLLKGMAGVFSGESRNSGALDVNIRGIQGPGRVPVIIDGTEQAITVYRGYNGASNRNYIDPNLISSIQVFKGGTNQRDVHSGIGGAMVVKTLVPDDVIAEGEDFGIEIRIEGSSNSVDERVPRLHTGERAEDVDGFPEKTGNSPYSDQTLRLAEINSRSANDNNPLAGKDYSYRIAGAKKTDNFDVLAAYAYRARGNYFSGKNNADYYSDSVEVAEDKIDYIRSLAMYWKPGKEVTNTSSMMESLLLKTIWRIDNEQKLSLHYRHSNTVYGEIMPSRISTSADRGYIQWPLSEVTSKAYSLNYTYKPSDTPWLDLHANLWRTDTQSDTSTSGGFPNQLRADDGSPLDGVLVNGSKTLSKNIRNGLSLSNKIELTPTLDLTVGGNFQYEKLSSGDDYDPELARSFPRAGRREEWDSNFNFAWKSSDKLSINAGMTYSSYWAYDDFLGDHPNQFFTVATTGWRDFKYETYISYTEAERETMRMAKIAEFTVFFDAGLATQAQLDAAISGIYIPYSDSGGGTVTGVWMPDADGNYDRADHPCLQGALDNVENATLCAGSKIQEIVDSTAEKQTDHGWVPHFKVSYALTDNSRTYIKYSETLRYPSIFESTIGWSASKSLYVVNPEHSYNWELGYVQDLTPWLTEAVYADFKFSFYHNLTKDVIDRDSELMFNNLDKQIIKGLELSFRYDNGKYFGDLGVNYVLKNKICDEDSAARASHNSPVRALANPIPTCFEYGFPSNYQLTQATPKLSANLSLGGRFLNRRLELGSRVTYYEGYKNSDLDTYLESSYIRNKDSMIGGFPYAMNTPFSWDDTLIVDAYARFKVNSDVNIELSATNLTDQYYADPATRSAMAAPGRTVKLSLTGRF